MLYKGRVILTINVISHFIFQHSLYCVEHDSSLAVAFVVLGRIKPMIALRDLYL